MNSRRAEKGIGKLTLLVFGTITGVAVWLGYHVLPFYYYYYELRNHFDAAIRVASTETDSEIRKKLMYHINKMGIPCEPEELKIERQDDVMTIQLRYQEVLYITWKGKDHNLHVFDFDATVAKRMG